MTKEEFKRIRKHIRWTQQQVGDYLGVNNITVFRIEKGETPIRRPVIMAMRQLEEKYTTMINELMR